MGVSWIGEQSLVVAADHPDTLAAQVPLDCIEITNLEGGGMEHAAVLIEVGPGQ